MMRRCWLLLVSVSLIAGCTTSTNEPQAESSTVRLSENISTSLISPNQSNQLRAHFLDVGIGSCQILECGTTAAIVVDCGEAGNSDATMQKQDVMHYADDLLDSKQDLYLVVSHPDLDHYSLLQELLEPHENKLKQVWIGMSARYYKDRRGGTFDKYLDGLRSALGKNFHSNLDNRRYSFDCGDATATVLTVNATKPKTSRARKKKRSNGSKFNPGASNANSLVLRVSQNNFSVTFMGDAEGLTEQSAIQLAAPTYYSPAEDLHTSVLSASHHGANTFHSNSLMWAQTVEADTVVFTAGVQAKKFGHPRCDVVERYEKNGLQAAFKKRTPNHNYNLRGYRGQEISHCFRCCTANNVCEDEVTTRKKYVTATNGTIVIAANEAPVFVNEPKNVCE